MDRNGLSHAEAGKLGAIASRVILKNKMDLRIAEYYKSPKTCPVCGSTISYEKKSESTYCSRSCAAKANNKKYPKRVPSRHQAQTCPTCGKSITGKNKFCNQLCANTYKHTKAVKEAESSGYFKAQKCGEAHRPFVKRYLVEKYGHKCSICGTTEWCGKPVPLVVDHIDGDSTNNAVDNFRLVCGNCDMQLPTYKSKNKNGRSWRRQYYQISGEVIKQEPRTKFVTMQCQMCGKEFKRRAGNVPTDSRDTDRFFNCSRSCSTKLAYAIKRGEYTEEQLREMHRKNMVQRD